MAEAKKRRVRPADRATREDLDRAARELQAMADVETEAHFRASLRRAAAYLEREVDRRDARLWPAPLGTGTKPESAEVR